MNISKIEKFLEPVDKTKKVSIFFGTVLGIDGSTLVVENKAGGTVYATNYAYCEVGDLVACLAYGTTIVAFASKDAQRVASDLTKVGAVYNSGTGITIDENNYINAEVTADDLTALETAINSKADATHSHVISDVTDYVVDSEFSTTSENPVKNSVITAAFNSAQETLATVAMTAEDALTIANTKANEEHTHAISDVAGLQAALDDKAASTHEHAIADVTGLQNALDAKASTTHQHTSSDITDLQTLLSGKSDTSHTHTLDSLGAAASSHAHEIADVNGLQAALNSAASGTDLSSVYPVGTCYLTKDSASDPAQLFGGTWVLIEDTYLFLGIKIYYRVE